MIVWQLPGSGVSQRADDVKPLTMTISRIACTINTHHHSSLIKDQQQQQQAICDTDIVCTYAARYVT